MTGLMATAEAFELVGEKRLEWGRSGTITVFLRTQVGLNIAHLNVIPIPTVKPTTSIFVTVLTLLIKEAELELQGVGAVGKHIEYGGTRRIAKVKLGITKKLVEPRLFGRYRRPRALKPTERS
ncbi:uncharacterized protein BcabD6B2_16870 [Babesia caballi]|uniref:Uncharacterized protein n=1 Tax=Babesia caballi TaxID=5871 RepID=A0AAV4LR27_BABCB|nr:hypothetical protein, conserved [Babesia caballi]